MTPEQGKKLQTFGIQTMNEIICQSEKNRIRISDAVAEFISGFSQAWQEVKKELDAE